MEKIIIAAVKEFFLNIESDKIYNEFSLQHELGFYLRKNLNNLYKIEFERNISHFGFNDVKEKKEIDIAIYKEKFPGVKDLLCVIELKYPRNRQVPEQMYKFCRDIRFLEEIVLTENRFNLGFFIALVNDSLFYSNYEKLKLDGIYRFFRNGVHIHGEIEVPTGKYKHKEKIQIEGNYSVKWCETNIQSLKYALIPIHLPL